MSASGARSATPAASEPALGDDLVEGFYYMFGPVIVNAGVVLPANIPAGHLIASNVITLTTSVTNEEVSLLKSNGFDGAMHKFWQQRKTDPDFIACPINHLSI